MDGHLLVFPWLTARNLQLSCAVFIVLLIHLSWKGSYRNVSLLYVSKICIYV